MENIIDTLITKGKVYISDIDASFGIYGNYVWCFDGHIHNDNEGYCISEEYDNPTEDEIRAIVKDWINVLQCENDRM